MKTSKYSEVLEQAEDGTTIGEVCRKTGISSLRAPDMIDVLELVCGEVGYPALTRPASSSPAIPTCGPTHVA